MYFVCIKQTTRTRTNRSTVLHNLFLLDMSRLNELVIKNDSATPLFVFMEGVQLSRDQVLLLDDTTSHPKVLNKFYHNNKFNIVVNIKFVLSIL